MGQPITVTEKPTTRDDVVRYELNRSLSGMGHETFRAGEPVTGGRPVDELGRRLLAREGVQGVHIYSNVVTVDLAPGAGSEGLLDVIRDLFLYYREGVTPAAPQA